MNYYICFAIISLCWVYCEAKDKPPVNVVVTATNVTKTPSVAYIVDAVECLKEAFTISETEDTRAKAYSELFEVKHKEAKWFVAVGYTTLYHNSTTYIETLVNSGGKSLKDDVKGIKYQIFSNN